MRVRYMITGVAVLVLPATARGQCISSHHGIDPIKHRDQAAAVFIGYPIREDTVEVLSDVLRHREDSLGQGSRLGRIRVTYVVAQAWKLPLGTTRERPLIEVEHVEELAPRYTDSCYPGILLGEWQLVFAHADNGRLTQASVADPLPLVPEIRGAPFYARLRAALGPPATILPPLP